MILMVMAVGFRYTVVRWHSASAMRAVALLVLVVVATLYGYGERYSALLVAGTSIVCCCDERVYSFVGRYDYDCVHTFRCRRVALFSALQSFVSLACSEP